MEISALVNKITNKKPSEPEQFLAVQIDTEYVKTAAWTIKNQTTDITGLGSTIEWDGSSTEILLEAIDNSLSVTLGKLGDSPEPNSVIFGLPEAWTSPEGIIHARLIDLKTICDKLSLKPLGYVVTTEAIAQHLKTKEGTPLSAVLLRVSTSEVAVSIIRLGVIEATHVAGRSGDVVSDVKEGLTRFGEQDSLPSRIILYNGSDEDLSDLTQQLLAFDWQTAFPFLHLPKIETMDETFSITAIATAGGSEAAKSLGIKLAESPPPEKPEMPEKPLPPPRPWKNLNLGWLKKVKILVRPIFGLIDSVKHIKLGPPPVITASKTTAIVAIAAFGVFLFGGFAGISAFKRISKVTINLSFAGEQFNDKLPITLDADAERQDLASKLLPAEKVTVSKSGGQAKETTGKKITGEKAKGEVTIYNRRTDDSKKFDTGTTLLAGDKKLSFILDEDVTIASASAGPDYSIVPGKNKAGISAAAIGPESNLETNTEFQIGNYSKSIYIAKNESALSGGSRKEIRVVSKNDQAELKTLVLASLKNQAKTASETDHPDKLILIDTASVKVNKEIYSADIGEETPSVSLDIDSEIDFLAVARQQLNNFLASLTADKIPAGFTINQETTKVSVENVNFENKKAAFDAIFQTQLVPQTDKKELISLIAGKRPEEAGSILKRLPHLKTVDMNFVPALPPVLQWIPVSPNNITINIKVEN